MYIFKKIYYVYVLIVFILGLSIINRIQNESFGLHIYICGYVMLCVYLWCVYINTHTFSIYFENIYLYIHVYIYIIILYINIFNKYK